MMLEFNIRNQEISRIDSFSPAEKSVGYLVAKFNFKTDDWNGASKIAVFKNLKTKEEYDKILEEDACIVPSEALSEKGQFEVSVYGLKDGQKITSNVATCNLNRTLLGGSMIEDDSLNAAEKLLLEVQNKLDKSGHAPNKFLGTDEKGNVVTKEQEEFSLEVAGEEKLGGVKPLNKTDDMTLEVGVDKEGRLFAKGRATGYVFDTLADLELALKDVGFTSTLVLGDNLYIRATDVPDYWWDGEQKQQLETQKVDLENYVTKSDLIKKANKSDISNFANALSELLNYVAWIDENGQEHLQYFLDSVSSQAELVSISAIFNGDNAEVGTNASELNIIVTGNYDDGTSRIVKGWTTDGVVALGQNTFTIIYNGKTCTVNVTGVPVEVVIEITSSTTDAQYAGNSEITKVVVKNAVNISGQTFLDCQNLKEVIFENGGRIFAYAFSRCINLTKVSFYAKAGTIVVSAFVGCTNLTDIYVSWSEGEVANAPWGAENAAIHYNTSFQGGNL